MATDVYDFEDLLSPIYASLVDKKLASNSVYDATNTDILRDGENLGNLILEVSELLNSKLANPDTVQAEYNNLVSYATELTQNYSGKQPDTNSLEKLMEYLKSYLGILKESHKNELTGIL